MSAGGWGTGETAPPAALLLPPHAAPLPSPPRAAPPRLAPPPAAVEREGGREGGRERGGEAIVLLRWGGGSGGSGLATIFGGSVSGRSWGRGGREWRWCGGGWIAAPTCRVLELRRSRLWRELVKRSDRSSGPPRCKGGSVGVAVEEITCSVLCVFTLASFSLALPLSSPELLFQVS